jgi:hypothetical protein
MKDLLSERLIQMATAQEQMTAVADMMEQWDSSQLVASKCAFDAMNVSDKVLNLSREGSRLVKKLQECCIDQFKYNHSDESCRVSLVLNEIQELFRHISEASFAVNEISHKIEGEAAFLKETEEGIKKTLGHVSESINSAVACAEFMLAEL